MTREIRIHESILLLYLSQLSLFSHSLTLSFSFQVTFCLLSREMTHFLSATYKLATHVEKISSGNYMHIIPEEGKRDRVTVTPWREFIISVFPCSIVFITEIVEQNPAKRNRCMHTLLQSHDKIFSLPGCYNVSQGYVLILSCLPPFFLVRIVARVQRGFLTFLT